jgi:hypothetical protein
VSGVLPTRRSNIEKWVWALIRAIDIPRIFRSGNTVSGRAVVESRRVAGWLTTRGMSTEAAQLVDCRPSGSNDLFADNFPVARHSGLMPKAGGTVYLLGSD